MAMLWWPVVAAVTAFGISVFDRVNTVPGVCGAMVAVSAAMTYASLLAGPPVWVLHSASGPFRDATAGTTPKVFSATAWPAAENR